MAIYFKDLLTYYENCYSNWRKLLMKYNKIHKGILEIPEFISKEENEKIIKILNNLSENFWLKNNNPNWDKRNLSEIKDLEFNDLKRKIGKRVVELFDSYYKIVNQSILIQRILPNTGGLSQHADNIDDPDVKYGLVLYYNDNYFGGEIEYPEIKISYKPRAGSLLIHRGEYLHKVNPVNGSTRYMSTLFVHETKDFPAKIKGIEL